MKLFGQMVPAALIAVGLWVSVRPEQGRFESWVVVAVCVLALLALALTAAD